MYWGLCEECVKCWQQSGAWCTAFSLCTVNYSILDTFPIFFGELSTGILTVVCLFHKSDFNLFLKQRHLPWVFITICFSCYMFWIFYVLKPLCRCFITNLHVVRISGASHLLLVLDALSDSSCSASVSCFKDSPLFEQIFH